MLVVVDKEKLENDLTIVADSIRAKSGTSEKLEFPQGYKSAVESIESGGGSGGNSQIIRYGATFHQTFKGVTFPDNYEIIIDSTGSTISSLNETFSQSNIYKVKIIGTSVSNFSTFGLFTQCKNLIEVDISELQCSPTTVHYMFYNTTSLKRIIGELDFTNMRQNFNYTFLLCNALEEVRFKANSIFISIGFDHSNLLSNESIQSIIDGLATVETTQTLTFHKDVKSKLTETQLTTITSKNWTLA